MWLGSGNGAPRDASASSWLACVGRAWRNSTSLSSKGLQNSHSPSTVSGLPSPPGGRTVEGVPSSLRRLWSMRGILHCSPFDSWIGEGFISQWAGSVEVGGNEEGITGKDVAQPRKNGIMTSGVSSPTPPADRVPRRGTVVALWGREARNQILKPQSSRRRVSDQFSDNFFLKRARSQILASYGSRRKIITHKQTTLAKKINRSQTIHTIQHTDSPTQCL